VDDRADALGIAQSDKSDICVDRVHARKANREFSTLAERANHLRKFLPINAEVLPVVFTAARIVESEAEAAVEYGLGLVVLEEIEHLLSLISTPGNNYSNYH